MKNNDFISKTFQPVKTFSISSNQTSMVPSLKMNVFPENIIAPNKHKW